MNDRGKLLERVTGIALMLCVAALLVLLTCWAAVEIVRAIP